MEAFGYIAQQISSFVILCAIHMVSFDCCVAISLRVVNSIVSTARA